MRTAPATQEDVWRVLEAVEDPELPVTVTDLGMVQDVSVEGGRVRVRLVPTYSACPAIDVMRGEIRRRVLALPGVAEVSVDLTFDEPWTMARLSERGRAKLAAYGLSLPQRRLAEPAPCPYCGSTDTVLENPFGPTLCRALYYCRKCRNPFERFRPPAQ